MPSLTDEVTEDSSKDKLLDQDKEKSCDFVPKKTNIIYQYVLSFTYFHIAGLYGLYLCVTSAKWATIGFGKYLTILTPFPLFLT